LPAPASPLELLHPCLSDPRPSSPLAGAVLSEHERIGVLLEGVALDAHLSRVGRRPAPRWDGARISASGRLVAVVAVTDQDARAADDETAVDRALALARVLFPDGGAAGRGDGRRIARELALRWTIGPPALAADELVRDVLEHAPFLWRPRFARHRESLAAVVRDGDSDRLSVAGPATFRRRAIERSGSRSALVALLRGAAAHSLWCEDREGDRAPAAGPTTARISSPIASPARDEASDGVLDRLATLHRAGRWRAVINEAQRLRRDGDDRGGELEIARRAIDACLQLWRFERAAHWGDYAVEHAAAGDAPIARLLAAWSRHETRELPRARVMPMTTPTTAPPPPPTTSTPPPRAQDPEAPGDAEDDPAAAALLTGGGSIEPLLAWARIETELRPATVAARLAAALADRSRRASIDRGRLWLELGRARRRSEELRCGADPATARCEPALSPVRAFTHALRHLRRGDHDLELWRAAAALLGERARRGELPRAELARADRVVAGLAAWAAADADPRRELEANVLAVRVEIAGGDLDRAAAHARAVLDNLPPRCRDRSRRELETLLVERRARLDAAARSDSRPHAPGSRDHAPDRGGARIAPVAGVGAGRDGARSSTEPTSGALDGIVGESRALHDALRRLERLAPGDLPVLLRGETGTGKELAAKRLHRQSSRRERPFVAVNCAALSDSLLLSELFGHARGAFTGADRERAGVFETAHGGTVFLDEIGDLPGGAQGALLRVLQEGEVRRVGESRPRRVDVRVVAATHRDLAALVERGAFRHDLYYRLNVAVVRLPPLRERGEDVLLLARHFLAAPHPSLALARDAEEILLAGAWPGNVRELRSVVQVAAAMHDGAGWLRARDLELPASPPPGPTYRGALDAERRRLLEQALSAAGGRRAEAAKRLGITPQAVSYLVRRLGLGAG
jgi:transcriptional regulator with AAA-type ATPase domain